ncbi:efflux RND transporter periplasmic adaptor subunit [Paracoccus sp. 11-3]|uniref:Efflux RND transporter periplasmic adaptor subunit n=1 Tax=Paracoccus amoyensis TaxID=2760093 RepID=A0A926GI24_9RHOB|nr:efflux RND transporter periplasmic adaptor subunit [Paracoccus amoyensis]MBC9247664.1 efflux RND transporter periplasmic adaptor subunit [Paracoccus amoyensis]
MKRFGRIVSLLILAALVISGLYLWRADSSAQTPTVMTAPVTRATIEQTVLANGILKPSRLVAVGAQVSGRITAVDVQLGQDVQAGDLIAEIDSVTQTNELRTAQAALANMQAQLKERQANLTLANTTLERQREMVQRRASAQSELDTADADVSVLEAQIEALNAQIEQARVAIENAQANVDYTRITAPIDGTVLAIVSQEGQTVNANQSTPTIVILGQLDQMTVRAEISEADVVNIKAGQSVYFNILGEPDTRYESTLEYVEPAPETIRSDSLITTDATTSSDEAIYYNGVFTVPNADRHLRTYMTAQVYVVLGRAENALTVPSSALAERDAAGDYTLRIKGRDGQIETRKVRIGLNDRVQAQVLSGLAEGDQVVTGEVSAATAAASTTGRGRARVPMGL